jgi:hypothetical protein
MEDKNNKNTSNHNHRRYDVVVKTADGTAICIECKSFNKEQVISHFVRAFYERHGKVMSKLAYE